MRLDKRWWFVIVISALFAVFYALDLGRFLRRSVDLIRSRRFYARWQRPGAFDRNLIVIGGGSAGLVTAYIAAALRAKVTLVERDRMGGDCLNTGCVSSKALIRTARLLSHMLRSKEFGIGSAQADFDFAEAMERVQRVIRTIEPHDSPARYAGLGVEVARGAARIASPWAVELPRRLVVLGGGPVGSELTQTFARLGSHVTLVEAAPRILMREDADASELVTARFRSEGIDVRVGHTARRIEVLEGEKLLLAEHEGREVRIAFRARRAEPTRGRRARRGS